MDSLKEIADTCRLLDLFGAKAFKDSFTLTTILTVFSKNMCYFTLLKAKKISIRPHQTPIQPLLSPMITRNDLTSKLQ